MDYKLNPEICKNGMESIGNQIQTGFTILNWKWIEFREIEPWREMESIQRMASKSDTIGMSVVYLLVI